MFFATHTESMGMSVLESAMSGALVIAPKRCIPANLINPLNHVIWEDTIPWKDVIELLDVWRSVEAAAPFTWQRLAYLMVSRLRLHGWS